MPNNAAWSNPGTRQAPGLTLSAIFRAASSVTPPTITATSASSGSINIGLSDAGNGDEPFSVERSLDNSSWTLLSSSLTASSFPYSSTGLSASTLYYYRVKAANSDYSAVVSATTSAASGGLSVSGTLARGSTLTLTGGTFGASGPNIVLFHAMEHGTAGNEVALVDPIVGDWSSLNAYYKMVYEAEPEGRVVVRSRRETDTQFGKFTLNTADFISHFQMINIRARNPDTVTFRDADAPRSLTGITSSKNIWFEGEEGTATVYDDIIDVVMGGTNGLEYGWGGNESGDSAWMTYDKTSTGTRVLWTDFFDFDDWNCFEHDYYQNEADFAETTKINAKIMSAVANITGGADYRALHYQDRNGPAAFVKRTFNTIRFPGLLVGSRDEHYDLFYLATGVNRQARIVVANAANYDLATYRYPCAPQAWSDSQIDFDLYYGKLDPATHTLFLHVWNADGTKSVDGLQLN